MDIVNKTDLFGRREIFTSQTEITDANIEDVMKKAMVVHEVNRVEIEYLFNYHKGKQPILDRIKEVREEINWKITENHASEIVSFKVGYVFGSPLNYVQRGKVDANKSDETKDDTRIATLNEMLFEEDKATKDRELGETLAICGIGHRLVYPKKNRIGTSPFDIINLDAQGTFVIKSNDIYKKPMLGVTFVKDCDSNKLKITAYSDKAIWTLESGVKGGFEIIGKTAVNPLGSIPIIEYINNNDRMGSFENVIPILDALNIATSDRLNDVSQFVQSLIWFNNVDIDEAQFKTLRQKGGIKTKSEQGTQATVSYLTASLDQSETQTFVDYLYSTVLQIAGVPDRKLSSGGNTGSAVMLSSGWENAETMARSTELTFGKSEKEMLRIILRILKDIPVTSSAMSTISLSDIDIKYSRNRTDNILTKTQSLVNQLEAGIHPRIAIATCGIYADSEQVYLDSSADGGFEKWKEVKETVVNNQAPGDKVV